MKSTQRGTTVLETVVILMIVGFSLAAASGPFVEMARACALKTATRRIGGLLIQSRAHAVFYRRATGLVFEQNAARQWQCFIVEDGDGDGILRDDIDTGRDPIIGEIFAIQSPRAGLGILEGVPDPAGNGVLGGNLDDPVRAGRGDIVTFTPQGTATPCSIYFSDGHSRMRVLRVLGVTGRVRALEWRRGWSEWMARSV